MTINTNLHPLAMHAARAARIERQIGSYAASRMVAKLGVPASVWTLARVLAAAERAGLN